MMRSRKAARPLSSTLLQVKRSKLHDGLTGRGGPRRRLALFESARQDDFHHVGSAGELAVLHARIEGSSPPPVIDGAITKRVARSAPLKSGAPLRCQMQFAGIAAHADVAGPAAQLPRIEMARADEFRGTLSSGIDG